MIETARLIEAAMHARKAAEVAGGICQLELEEQGIRVTARRSIAGRPAQTEFIISYCDLETARINPLLITITEAVDSLVRLDAKSAPAP